MISDWGHEWAGGRTPPDGFDAEDEVSALVDLLSGGADATDTDVADAP